MRLHESVKVELETYAREIGERDRQAVHACDRARHDARRGVDGADQVGRLLRGPLRGQGHPGRLQQTARKRTRRSSGCSRSSSADEPTEIVIHVNMLKEGWDVTNLYTIVPLRAANARTLIEQSIGRGLRLPYGKRTG